MMYKQGGCHPKHSYGNVNVGVAEEFVMLICVILKIQVHPLGIGAVLSEVCMSSKCCKNVPCYFTSLKPPALLPEGHGTPLGAA